jgi:hypothetical protein
VPECLLFVDRLGTKAALRDFGTASRHLTVFQDLLAALIAARSPSDSLIESDSGVAIFSDVVSAILAGEAIFQAMFDAEGPIWMRGVIVGCPGIQLAHDLRQTRQIGSVLISSPAAPLLNALVAEKSGFKGFRLRVESALISPQDRNVLVKRIVPEEPYDNVRPSYVDVYRTSPLRFAGAMRADGFEDVLWMVDDEPEFNSRDEELSYRLRRAGRDPEESVHAAMTKVVFEEVRAIARITRR